MRPAGWELLTLLWLSVPGRDPVHTLPWGTDLWSPFWSPWVTRYFRTFG